MRLADHFIAASNAITDPVVRTCYHDLSKHIIEAQHFELLLEVKDACINVIASKPSSILSALKFAKAPFSATWVEWPGNINGMPDNAQRMGCLIRLSNRGGISGISVTAVIETHEHIHMSPITAFFSCDTSLNNNSVPNVINVSKGGRDVGLGQDMNGHNAHVLLGHPQSVFSEEEQSAIKNIMSHFALDNNNLYELHNKEMVTAKDEILMGIHNTRILFFIISFLILLSSKDGIEQQTKEDFSKLNKRRIAKHKAPLQEFIVTRLNVHKTISNRGVAQGLSRARVRQHLVRGHFKVRQSGVYWWSPFIRGNGVTKLLRDHYDVRM